MPHVLRRTLSMLLPLPFQRRRITQATEMILSNIDLYASVTVLVAGDRLVMELRAPAAIPAPALESIRRYLVRKLDHVLGLTLHPQQVYLVALPPSGVRPAAAPTTSVLKRIVQALPQWEAAGAQSAGDWAAMPSRRAFADSLQCADSLADSSYEAPASLQFDLPANSRFAVRDGQPADAGASDAGTGFAKTQPLGRAVQAA